jgi:hypothetical protein
VECGRKKLLLQESKKTSSYNAGNVNREVPEIFMEVGLEIIFGCCNPVFNHESITPSKRTTRENFPPRLRVEMILKTSIPILNLAPSK